MTEPKQMNSGIPQGKFLTRQRLPTGQGDRVVHWKDLNCAMDLIVYGKVSFFRTDSVRTRLQFFMTGHFYRQENFCPSDYSIYMGKAMQFYLKDCLLFLALARYWLFDFQFPGPPNLRPLIIQINFRVI